MNRHSPSNAQAAAAEADTNDIFVVGSFVVGVTVRVPRWLHPGETLLGDRFDLGPGGKGTNQAIAARRQGAGVRLMLAIGDDLFGRMASELFDREQLDQAHVLRMAGESTGCGIVTLRQDGENMIALYPGANLSLSPEHIAAAEADIRRSKILLCQCETRPETILAALKAGRRNGCFTILNPAPARELPPEVFPLIDLLTPNETEARLLLGAGPDEAEESLIARLRDRGIKTVIMTRGARGALICDAHGTRVISAPKITPLDPTGAGDTFNGVLAAGLAAGLDMDTAVFRATRAGAWCAMHLGVIAGLPTASELETFINQTS